MSPRQKVDYATIPQGVPLILTLEFPCVDPYEVPAVYRVQGRHGRGKRAATWEHLPARQELHDTAVEGITAWRTASQEEIEALTSNRRREK